MESLIKQFGPIFVFFSKQLSSYKPGPRARLNNKVATPLTLAASQVDTHQIPKGPNTKGRTYTASKVATSLKTTQKKQKNTYFRPESHKIQVILLCLCGNINFYNAFQRVFEDVVHFSIFSEVQPQKQVKVEERR